MARIIEVTPVYPILDGLALATVRSYAKDHGMKLAEALEKVILEWVELKRAQEAAKLPSTVGRPVFAKSACEHGLPRGGCAVCGEERIRREYEGLARITGRSIAELELDLTAPDPGLEVPA